MPWNPQLQGIISVVELARITFEQTREHLRGASARHIRETLEEDIGGLTLGGR